MPLAVERYNFRDLDILIVDDNPFAHAIIRDVLLAMRIVKIRHCNSAKECISHLVDRLPDILIADLLMTPIDGFELIRRIRAHENEDIRHLPILVTTAHSSSKIIRTARDVGASEVLCKPFSVASIYDRFVHMRNHPRQFVKTQTYVGPDRRRTLRGFEGMDRRGGENGDSEKDN